MAKINPVKVKQDADKLEKAGKLPEAIALYKQVIEDNPRDWNIVNKVGDLYAKLNKNKDAADYYAKVADFYAKDGFHLKAIAIWKKINKLDATSLDPYLNLAELYAKQGLMMEAKSQYQYVVDEYIKRSKMREAGDVLKKMADIDPSDLKIRSKLADLYTREGNSGKAIEEHVAIAEELTKKGHLAEALQVLEKGLKIDSKSGRLRLELGRIHLVQKNYDKAVHFLEEATQGLPNDPDIMGRLGEAYLGSKRIAEAEGLFKRLLEINPNDEDTRVQMARVSLQQNQFDRAYEEMEPLVEKLVQRRDGDRAATLLQQIVQKSPNHVKTLNRLVEVYQQFSKESSLLATYSQLTEAYIQQGQLGEAASVLEVLVQREPANAQHKTKLQFVKGKLGGAAPSAPAPAAASPELIEEEFDLSAADEAPAPAPAPSPAASRAPAPAPARAAAPAAGPARPAIQATGPLSDQDREFIDEHLAEGKVFRKYGLIDKAADQFEAVVSRFSDNLESRQELREVYAEKGLPAKAAEHCLALAEIFRLKGDAASAKKYEDEAEQHVPGSARPAAKAAAPVAKAAPAPARAPAPSAPAPVVEEEFSLGDEEEIPLGGEEDIPIGFDEPVPVAAAPAAPADEESLDLDQELAGGQDIPSPFIDEEPAAAPAVEEDVSIGFDEATLDAPIAAEAPVEEVGFGVEDEFPLDEPAPAPPPPPPARAARPAPPPAAKPAAKPAPPPPAPKPAPVAKAAPAKPAPPPPAPNPAPRVEAPPSRPAPAPPVARAAAPRPAPPAELRAAPLVTKAPGGPPTGRIPVDLIRLLEEVESYVSLGFVDDAKELLREGSVRFKDHPVLLQKIAELGLEESAPEPEPAAEYPAETDLASQLDLGSPSPAAYDPLGHLADDIPAEPEPSEAENLVGDMSSFAGEFADETSAGEDLLSSATEPVGGEGGMDLGSELGELFGAQSAVEEPQAESASTELGDAGLADIFKEFKKGVDKQLGKEDYDTRYNLGIAYKEMGLLDEAIAEFQLAAKDEARLLECASMLGICFLEKGMPKLAMKWFERGLKAPGRTEEEYSALRYDLATAHEAAGDVDRALALFSDLYGQDANFRDVATKVRDLRAMVQG